MRRACENVRCARCGGVLREGDKYCRTCGRERAEIPYDPRRNIMACVYGPRPVRRNHICDNCGYKWENIVMIDKDRYCPECGNLVRVEEENGL